MRGTGATRQISIKIRAKSRIQLEPLEPGGHGSNAGRLRGRFHNFALMITAGFRRQAAAGHLGAAVWALRGAERRSGCGVAVTASISTTDIVRGRATATSRDGAKSRLQAKGQQKKRGGRGAGAGPACRDFDTGSLIRRWAKHFVWQSRQFSLSACLSHRP